MSKRLWNYLYSRVQVVTNDGEIIKGHVIDFVDEMDNEDQYEITILIDDQVLTNQLKSLYMKKI